MATNTKIKQDFQKFAPGDYVVLWILDLTNLGGSVFRFCQGTLNGDSVKFQGQTYFPINIEAEGFEFNGEQMPQPKLRLTNSEILIQSAITTYDDMIGGLLYRKRTFAKYLDGQPDADSAAEFMPDIYVIERKTSMNKQLIELECSAYLDAEGRKIPNRIVIKKTCPKIYRIWDADNTEFIYPTEGNFCPYDGSNYFKRDGSVTANPAEDKCGRKLSDCKLRYPNKTPKPFGGFPGIQNPS